MKYVAPRLSCHPLRLSLGRSQADTDPGFRGTAMLGRDLARVWGWENLVTWRIRQDVWLELVFKWSRPCMCVYVYMFTYTNA